MGLSVVLVGCGNMGYAMLSGWIKSGQLAASAVTVVEPNEALRERAAELGAKTSSDGISTDSRPDLIVFAIKPQMARSVLPAYAAFGAGSTTFVSVLAGTQISTFEEILGAGTPVIRCMPNTPAAIGKGMLVTYANSAVAPDLMQRVNDLLATSGRVASIEREELMDAVTAVSGSGPAYVFHFIECLTDAAVTAGLPLETARLLAMQTVYGAASLAAESAEEPGELRRQVTSPNGTTAAALAVLMGDNRMKTMVTEAVEAARLRGIELAK